MKTNKQVKFRDQKEGFCNICKKPCKFTRDHIPPRGCVKPTLVELRTLTQYLSEPSEKPRDSQSGLNLLSICGNCNNTLLGREYDPELIKVSKQVANMVRVQRELGLSLPEKIDLIVKPQRLIRAVVGHILAGEVPTPGEAPRSAPFPDALRSYFDRSSDIPDKLEVYYWVYPSKKQIVLNWIGKGSAMGEGFIPSSSLLKFFPLAFWIVWDKPASFPISFTRISKDKFKGLDETCELILELRNIPPLDYPESPGEDEFIMYREQSTLVAQPKKRKEFG